MLPPNGRRANYDREMCYCANVDPGKLYHCKLSNNESIYYIYMEKIGSFSHKILLLTPTNAVESWSGKFICSFQDDSRVHLSSRSVIA